ncbi:MAG TPA: type II 3-dehydroquinate dehydratase [Candidatus Eisenbergiella merdigallinarum]|uniref:3-dehydroquinate dehydratase n=1 Tax=Candidatus Eisenbergiella merdigallinarum TaxID=2838552 RepID=A0A9D2MT66_9FIRM|nr:type II 3-dehydroquinate dehydratase [Candidatus Eisenbergiella merdigallinarum]
MLVINGPNLNFLGIREKGVYGTRTYQDLLDMIARKGISCRAAIDVFQSNHEGAIIDRIQAAYFDGTEGIVINPGAYTHYSYAIRDALASVAMPKVEIHISNIMEREEFRHVSVTAPACDKQIYGHGLNGYLEAIDFILSQGTEQISAPQAKAEEEGGGEVPVKKE